METGMWRGGRAEGGDGPGTDVALVGAAAGWAGPVDPDLVDPDLDDPRLAAAQYRRLLAASDQARARADQHTRERLRGSRATARRHRDAAADIRARVENVWKQVAEPLAPYGLTELDQLRAVPGEGAATGPGAAPPAAPVEQRGGRPLARARRDPDPGWRSPGSGVALRKTGAPRSDDRAAGGAHARSRSRSDRTGRPVPPSSAGPVPVDPRTAPREAYDLCLDAMSKAAELRAVSRGSSSASAGLFTALACLLSLVIVGVLRAFASAQAVPCLVGAALAAAALVMIGAGGEDGGPKAAFRAGMLGAGTAAVAVLATFRLAPVEPLGVVASLVALVAAIRFGLGLGSGSGPEPAGGARTGGSRKG